MNARGDNYLQMQKTTKNYYLHIVTKQRSIHSSWPIMKSLLLRISICTSDPTSNDESSKLLINMMNTKHHY